MKEIYLGNAFNDEFSSTSSILLGPGWLKAKFHYQNVGKPRFWQPFGLRPKSANISHLACQIFDTHFCPTFPYQIFAKANLGNKTSRPLI